jgi:hypothetical protein
MDLLLPALLTGTVVGAAVTGIMSLLKPVVDFWLAGLLKRQQDKAERRKLVEGVVDRLRTLRVDNVAAGREGRSPEYDLVLGAADEALLIHDRAFADYLSRDIENVSGFDALCRWEEDHGDGNGEMTAGEAARSARFDHLKELVKRTSEFAVTGKWEKEWAQQAVDLEQRMNKAWDETQP